MGLKIFAACDDLYYYPPVSSLPATIRGADPLVRGRRPRRPSFGCGYAALWGRLFRLQTRLACHIWPLVDQVQVEVCEHKVYGGRGHQRYGDNSQHLFPRDSFALAAQY
jgi:hypothetical protein